MTERRNRICAIADDLTGAAEIAGVAFRHGLAATILLDPTEPPAEDGAAVYDTDTRLHSAAAAVAGVRYAAAHLRAFDEPSLIYKKTDSVLRGNVRAEVETLAGALHRRRVMLVPANPSQGRTIQRGVYRLHDVPLAETEFARDPHHPARTSHALELLGAGTMPLFNATAREPLPDDGIVLGDATSAADLAHWAERIDGETLPAGGREFFEACLQVTHGDPSAAAAQEPRPPSRPALIISGSLAGAAHRLIDAAKRASVAVLSMPAETDSHALMAWRPEVQSALARSGVAVAVVGRAFDPDPQAPARIAAAFAQLARELVATRAVRHLVIEGGATAAAVLRAIGIPRLRVTGEWAPGVVALEAGDLGVTMKPGSYAWPESLLHALFSRA